MKNDTVGRLSSSATDLRASTLADELAGIPITDVNAVIGFMKTAPVGKVIELWALVQELKEMHHDDREDILAKMRTLLQQKVSGQ